MSEPGESTEMASDLIMETTKEDKENGEREIWHKQVAFSTLVMAGLTAIGALLAGITAHNALLERTKEIVEISILGGDRVNIEVLKAKHEILLSLGETPEESETDQIRAYEVEIEELKGDAAGEEAEILSANFSHLVFPIAVTLLAVGITVSGMSIIVEQEFLWIVGIVFGVVGAVGVGISILTMVS